MTAVVVVLLLALAALVVVLLDRVGQAEGESRAAAALTGPLGRVVAVHVMQRPFVTQALRGRYAQVRVTSGGLCIGEMAGATLRADLRNVHLPLGALLRGRVVEVVCEHVDGEILLPYGELARAARIPGLELQLDGERLMASAAVPVPGISQLARVRGEAVLSLAGEGTVWMRVRGVSVVGIAVPSLVLKQLVPALNVPIPLPELPYGLHVDALRPSQEGLTVHGSARATVFRAAVDPIG